MQVPGDRRGRPLEHRARQRGRPRVLAAGEVQQRQVPQQMVPEPVQTPARVNGRWQACHAAVEVGRLVEGVGEGVHRPGVARVQRERRLGRTGGLGAAAVLLQREGVQAEREGVAGILRQHRLRQRQHLGEAPLPEIDVVEALEHHDVAREGRQVRAHRRHRVVQLAGRPQRQGLHVAALALGQDGGGGAGRLGRLARLGEPLLEEEADGGAGVGEGEAGVGGGGRPEEVEGGRLPAEQRAHRAIVGLQRGGHGGGDGQAVGVAARAAHASRQRRGRARRRGTAPPAARPTTPSATAGPRRSRRGRRAARTPPARIPAAWPDRAGCSGG